MLLPDGGLAAAGIFPDAIIHLTRPARGLVLRMTPYWHEALVVFTPEERTELEQDGLLAVKLWDHGTKGVLVQSGPGNGRDVMTEAENVNAEHYFELPLGKVDAFRCLCRLTWLRTSDPERCMTSDGRVLHISSDGVFRCCTRAWKWTLSSGPGEYHWEGKN